MSILKFDSVHKSFGEGTQATPVLNGIDLEVAEGEFLVILGFSGTGKTTLINLMAGLEQPTRGKVTFKGEPITGPGPERGVIFQSYSLMPWLSVTGNVKLAVDAMFAAADALDLAPEKESKQLPRTSLEECEADVPAERHGGRAGRFRAAAERLAPPSAPEPARPQPRGRGLAAPSRLPRARPRPAEPRAGEVGAPCGACPRCHARGSGV